MKLTQTAAVMIALTFAASAVHAAQVDDTVILDGFVKSVDWSGDQLTVVFHSNDGYDTADWTLTGPRPADLLHMGWSKDLLRPNDRIDAYIHPDRNGATKGALIRFLLADGSTLEASLHSDLDIAPRAALYRVFENPADDPMAGYYANTRTCLAKSQSPEGQYNCTSWWNADHTFSVYENNLYAEGGQGAGLVMQNGLWWLEMQRPDQWVSCQLVTGALKPRCHSPVNFGKSGDKWSILFHGRDADWTEYRTVEEGRH
jgi:hypothetical protein